MKCTKQRTDDTFAWGKILSYNSNLSEKFPEGKFFYETVETVKAAH